MSSYETTSSEDSGEEDQDEVEEVDSSEPEVEQGEESGTAQEEAAAGEQGDGVQAEVAEGFKESDAAQAAMSPQEEQPVRWDGGPWWNEGVGVIAFHFANNE